MRFEHVSTGEDAATIRVGGLRRSLRILHLTDSHMAEGDERDPAAAEHVPRFRQLFQEHTPGGAPAREVFEGILAAAGDPRVDAAALTGDIVHFPSWAALETVRRGVDTLGVPFLYTLGNHDWHFPHLPWGEATRRDHYPRFGDLTGGDPACQSLSVDGVRLVALDNSTYQLSAVQVAYLRRELSRGGPCLLFMHIPLWLESLHPAVLEAWQAPIAMAAPDAAWTAEALERWKVGEATASTRAARELITGPEAHSLAGIFCGHVHFAHADAFREGGVQYVTAPGFAGHSREIRLEPM